MDLRRYRSDLSAIMESSQSSSVKYSIARQGPDSLSKRSGRSPLDQKIFSLLFDRLMALKLYFS